MISWPQVSGAWGGAGEKRTEKVLGGWGPHLQTRKKIMTGKDSHQKYGLGDTFLEE